MRAIARKKTRRLPETTALVPRYGTNRALAHEVGEELRGCQHVNIVFAGSMCEIPAIKAAGCRTLNVNDIHPHLMNLARVVQVRGLQMELFRLLKRLPFHPQVLAEAQERCRLREVAGGKSVDDGDQLFASGFPHPVLDERVAGRAKDGGSADVQWAADYFVCCCMSRHETGGTARELEAPLSTRWNAAGGDSNEHYRSLVRSLCRWRMYFTHCNFTALDFRDFLAKCKNTDGSPVDGKATTRVGIYLDPTFPGPGDRYKFVLTEKDHRWMALRLLEFPRARVVLRFYDHPLVRELYPESSGWTWRLLAGGKTQTNDEAPEVLILNGASLVETADARG